MTSNTNPKSMVPDRFPGVLSLDRFNFFLQNFLLETMWRDTRPYVVILGCFIRWFEVDEVGS